MIYRKDGWTRTRQRRRSSSSWWLKLTRCCRAFFLLLCFIAVIYIASHSRLLVHKEQYQQISLTVWQHDSSRVTRPEGQPTAVQLGDNTPSNLGVFILVDLATHQPNTNKLLANCSETLSVSGRYRQYVLYYPSQSPPDADRRQAQRVADEAAGCTMPSTVVRVDGGHNRDAAALNLVMMDAYLDDGVDLYLVVFAGTPVERTRNLLRLAPTLRDRVKTTRQWKGVMLMTRDTAEADSTGRQLPAAMFLTKTHFDIFGLFFPVSLPDLPSAVALLADLYLHTNVTMNFHAAVEVVSKSHGAAASWPQVWQQELDTLTRYLAAESSTQCLRCRPRSTSGKGLWVISMSLYGADRRYTMGAVRNAQLAPVTFPGWLLRIYVEQKAKPRHAAVPQSILRRLQQLGAEFVDAPSDRLAPMMWRFTVLDDVGVEKFVVRDTDSRLTPRDGAVVADWLRHGANHSFHCIRDHPSHSGYTISGGLWGGNRAALANRFGGSLQALMARYDARYIADMNFLGTHVWPRVQADAYCHDSYSCDRFPGAHAFPVKRQGAEHIGAVYDQLSVMRKFDTDILERAPVNRNCVPLS